MTNKKIYVAYGSQTGNSESIAKDLNDQLLDAGFIVEFQPLNKLKGRKLQDDCLLLAIACSTTGNGDAPENADAWWRAVKLRSVAKDMFQGVNYCVLGLGDTNYDKFCHMGKQIDKRLSELSAHREIPIACADEATNLEEIVEKWKQDVRSLVDRLSVDSRVLSVSEDVAAIALSSAHGTDSGKSSTHQSTDPSPAEQVTATAVDVIAENKTKSAFEVLKSLRSAPQHFYGIQEISEMIGDKEKWQQAVENTVVTAPRERSQQSLEVSFLSTEESLSRSQSSSQRLDERCTESDKERARLAQGDFSADRPFRASITDAQWLSDSTTALLALHESASDWGSARRVVQMCISLEGSGIKYQPGDAIAVLAPNRCNAVDIVLKRLRESHNDISLDLNSFVNVGEDIVSLGDLLRFRIDLCGSPKKATLNALALTCADPLEAKTLALLGSRDALGKKLFSAFVEQQALGIADLLVHFQSCRPTLLQLLTWLPSVPPRYYSIACAPDAHPESVYVAFSVVRRVCSLTGESNASAHSATQLPLIRSGLCTSYLEFLSRRWLYPEDSCNNSVSVDDSESLYDDERDCTLRVYLKPSLSFHLPGNVSLPLIMVGPGTGVAPFMGFIQQRWCAQQERRRSRTDTMNEGLWRGGFELDDQDLPCESNSVQSYISSVAPGPMMLFYGCRDSRDYLFKDQLAFYLREGTLSVLDVAMSRLPDQPKVYVTNKLLARQTEIARLILRENAIVYICGDGNSMAKDVQAALKTIVCSDGMSDEEATSYLNEMRQRRRLLLDIW